MTSVTFGKDIIFETINHQLNFLIRVRNVTFVMLFDLFLMCHAILFLQFPLRPAVVCRRDWIRFSFLLTGFKHVSRGGTKIPKCQIHGVSGVNLSVNRLTSLRTNGDLAGMTEAWSLHFVRRRLVKTEGTEVESHLFRFPSKCVV